MSVATMLARMLVFRTGRQAYFNLKPRAKELDGGVVLGAVVAFLVVLFLLARIIVVVRSGQVGVLFSVFSGGTVLDRTYGEGIHLILPWDTMYRYDTRVHESTETVRVQTEEGLSVEVAASIRYRIARNAVSALHVDYGPDYEQVLVTPVFLSSIREAIGQYRPEQLYSTAPAEIQQKAMAEAVREMNHRPVEIDSIVFKSIKLPADVDKAIEAKLVEKQEVLRYQFVLEKTYKEALRRVIEAQGIQLYQEGINAGLTENFLRYKGIEATAALAQSSNSKIVVVGGKDGLPLILNPDSPPQAAARAAPPRTNAGPPEMRINTRLEKSTDALRALWAGMMSAKIPAKVVASPPAEK